LAIKIEIDFSEIAFVGDSDTEMIFSILYFVLTVASFEFVLTRTKGKLGIREISEIYRQDTKNVLSLAIPTTKVLFTTDEAIWKKIWSFSEEKILVFQRKKVSDTQILKIG